MQLFRVNIVERHRRRHLSTMRRTDSFDFPTEKLDPLEDRLFSLRYRLAQFHWMRNMSPGPRATVANPYVGGGPLTALRESIAEFRRAYVGVVSDLAGLEQQLAAEDAAISAEQQAANL